MSIFHCEGCHTNHDSDFIELVVVGEKMYCVDSAPELEALRGEAAAWAHVLPELQRILYAAGAEGISPTFDLLGAVGQIIDDLYTAPSAAVVSEDAQRLDAIRDNAWTLTPFDMPTGGGDADIGWAVTEMHSGKSEQVQAAIVYEDDPRKAIDAALTASRGGA